jgi:hypothetical protein
LGASKRRREQGHKRQNSEQMATLHKIARVQFTRFVVRRACQFCQES